MIEAVACQRAIPTARTRADIFQAPVGGRGSVIAAEIHQMFGIGNAVGIVTRRAGGFLVHDVKLVAPRLSCGIYSAEALIAQDTVAAVALIAHIVNRNALRIIVG